MLQKVIALFHSNVPQILTLHSPGQNYFLNKQESQIAQKKQGISHLVATSPESHVVIMDAQHVQEETKGESFS